MKLISSLLAESPEFNIRFACSDFRPLTEFVRGEQLTQKKRIDILLYDGSPQHSRSYETMLKEVRKIKQNIPECHIIFIGDFEQGKDIFLAIRYGASGLLERNSSFLEMLDSLKMLGKGAPPISLGIVQKIFQHYSLNNFSPLTDRELEILELLSNGYTFWKIAETVDVHVETVKTHVRHIYDKLDVTNKMEALDVAKANRFIL